MGEGKRGCSLRRLRALFAAGTATGLTDGELLERYAARRSESAEAAAAAEMAFAALVDRHGPMVWGVCRRVLGDAHEAEDAFQATFLVLVRKVRSVRVDGSLGRWLYGVAHRVALRARSEAERRRSGIDRVPTRSSHDPVGDVELRDLRDAVSEELDRLPAKYRCPVELCHLQGMTYDQAARELNWPVATVKSRLTKGRLRLRQGLARRGLAPGAVAGGLATALTVDARAAVPQALARSTVRAATSCATGSFPAAVIALTEGVLKMMMWERRTILTWEKGSGGEDFPDGTTVLHGEPIATRGGRCNRSPITSGTTSRCGSSRSPKTARNSRVWPGHSSSRRIFNISISNATGPPNELRSTGSRPGPTKRLRSPTSPSNANDRPR
jgi:RNA polymerase sigma factor (sigma-70 family)